jgi:hypothetical protein
MRSWLPPVLLLVIAAVPMLLLPTPGSLDVRFYYSGAQARAFLTGLSAAQAHTYLLHEWWDLLFIAAYSWIFVKLLRTRWALLPGALDFVETTMIIGALSGTAVAPLGVITALKWFTAPLMLILGLRKRFLAAKAAPVNIR